MTPLVSVVMPTYNHAAYVRQAMESVLGQNGVELELLVEDDGSTDGTPDVVRQVRDPRVHFTDRRQNEGAGITTNGLIGRARGEFVALINSDDVWARPDKLALQVQLLRRRPEVGACFGRARFIGPDGAPLGDQGSYSPAIFAQPNRSRARWLRQFFTQGNCLCHPTLLIRRSVYEALGGYDNRLRQVPDLDMWVRLARQHDLHVMEEELVSFRLTGAENASAPTLANNRRVMNEYLVVLENALDGVPHAQVVDGFGDLLAGGPAGDGPALEVQKALLHFKVDGFLGRIHRTIGLRKVYHLLGRPDTRAAAAQLGVGDLWFQQEMARHSPFLDVREPVPAPSPAPVQPAAAAARSRPLLRYLSFLRR